MAAIYKDEALFLRVGEALNDRISLRQIKVGVVVDIATAILFGAVICWYAPSWDLTSHSWFAYAAVTSTSSLCAVAGFRVPVRAINWSMERSESGECSRFRAIFARACRMLSPFTQEELAAAPIEVRQRCTEIVTCGQRALELLSESRAGVFSPLPKNALDLDLLRTLVDRTSVAVGSLELG